MQRMMAFFIIGLSILWINTSNGQSESEEKHSQTTASEVQTFAKEAFLAVTDFSFDNYEEKLQSASRYFTAEAWQRYLAQLNASQTFSLLKSLSGSMSGSVNKPPIILSSSKQADGVTEWKLQFSATIVQSSSTLNTNIEAVVTMSVLSDLGERGIRGMLVNDMTTEINPAALPIQTYSALKGTSLF